MCRKSLSRVHRDGYWLCVCVTRRIIDHFGTKPLRVDELCLYGVCAGFFRVGRESLERIEMPASRVILYQAAETSMAVVHDRKQQQQQQQP